MSDLLPCVERVVGDGSPTAAVVWMHGLGADGNDFVPVLPYLGLGGGEAVRFVFPHAPSIPVTINGGFVMPAWYDIRDGDLATRHDEDGIRRSAKSLSALVRREIERGVAPGRIVLAGFSQGGAMALHNGLRHPEPLAGIIALSTYLVLDDRLAEERSEANAATPVLMVHGSMDPIVALERGEAARDRLRELGYPVEWHQFPMGHEVCQEELEAIGVFLRDLLD
jgi:phospholipase/carboxylesterase